MEVVGSSSIGSSSIGSSFIGSSNSMASSMAPSRASSRASSMASSIGSTNSKLSFDSNKGQQEASSPALDKLKKIGSVDLFATRSLQFD